MILKLTREKTDNYDHLHDHMIICANVCVRYSRAKACSCHFHYRQSYYPSQITPSRLKDN